MTIRDLFKDNRFVALMYLLATVFVFATWVWGADSPYTSLNGDPRSKLSDLIHGTADNPFVQRALVPFLTRTIYGIVPETAWKSLSETLTSIPKVSKEMARLGWEPEFLPEYLIALSLACCSLALFPFVLRSFFNDLYVTETSAINAVPLATLFCLPVFFHVGTHYIYDFPALFFFSTGLLVMNRKQWFSYYLIFAAGCFNKETMILLAVAFVFLFYKKMRTSGIAGHLTAHLLVFGTIKLLLLSWYGSNAGGSVEFHLFGNLHNLLYGYTFTNVVLFTVVALLVLHDFGKKHGVLQRTAWLIVPFGVLMVCFAWLDEIRDLYELVPIYSLLIAHTIAFSWMKVPYALRPEVS